MKHEDASSDGEPIGPVHAPNGELCNGGHWMTLSEAQTRFGPVQVD